MYILYLIIGILISSLSTLALHCFFIIGKKGEEKWEEEVIMKKEDKKE